MEEIWKDIPDHKRYEVSNLGRIRFKATGRIKVLQINEMGYHVTSFRILGTRKAKKIFAHRAVAMAFIPNPLSKPEINHINGKPLDNRVENLEWCTRQENVDHAWRTGLAKPRKGPSAGSFKPNQGNKPVVALNDFDEIVHRYPSVKAANSAVGLSKGMVCRALKGRRKHAGGFQWKYESDLKNIAI